MNRLAAMALLAFFVVCTGAFLAFLLIAWLGWLFGLLWVAAALVLVLPLLWRISRYTGVRGPRG
jgi:predicted ferric reductase